jgi:hypothetical protein
MFHHKVNAQIWQIKKNKNSIENVEMYSPCKLSKPIVIIQPTPTTPFSSPHGFVIPYNAHQSECISPPHPFNKHFEETKKCVVTHHE